MDRFLPATLCFLLLLSCSDDNSPVSPLDGTPGADARLPDLGPGRDVSNDAGRPPACVDQDAKLQAALDSARRSPNAMLVVSNTACGTTVYLSGDSATATAASLWRIGSVTKTYVAATILTLVRDGKLALDDPLSKWVPGVPDTDGVTVKMLLDHTSGIFNYTDDPETFADPMKERTPEELVEIATTGHSPYFAPGAGWHYSNTNYILLGMIAEKAGGAAAHALIRKRALEPAGLDETFFEGKETLAGKLAAGFDQKMNNVTDKYSMSWPWAAGAMTATGADLCDWIRTLFSTTKVLTEAERKTMLDGVTADAATKLKYGLGVFLLDPGITAGAGPGMGHGGDIFGYHTQAYWFPAKGTAICSVVNQDGTSPNDLTLAALLTLFSR